MPSLFNLSKSGMETFQPSKVVDDVKKKMARDTVRPHLWVTLGDKFHDLGTLETDPAAMAMGNVDLAEPNQNQWMAAVIMIVAMIDEAIDLSAKVTVEWPGSESTDRNSLAQMVLNVLFAGLGTSNRAR